MANGHCTHSGAGPMSDYSGLPQLFVLDMSHNQLSGSLPAVTLLPPKTTSLDLSANHFAGGFNTSPRLQWKQY